MATKYVLYFERSAGVNVLRVSEVVKESPKTLKIIKSEFGSCGRERLNKQYDKYKIISKEQAKMASYFFKLIYEQYNDVKVASVNSFHSNVFNIFDSCKGLK